LQVDKSHSLSVLSQLDEITKLLSFEISTHEIKWECPFNDLAGFPILEVLSPVSLLTFCRFSVALLKSKAHTITALSLDPETKSG
jgi:hypothetical protein